MEMKNSNEITEDTKDVDFKDDNVEKYFEDEFESDSEDNIPKKNENNQKRKNNKKVLLKRRWSDNPTIIRRNKIKTSIRDVKHVYSAKEHSYATERLLSAKKHELTDLNNRIKDLERQLKEVHQENRLLKRFQARQEREFFKIETAKGELPDILQSHSEEVYALKKHVKKGREKNRELTQSLKAKNIEIQLLKMELNEFKQLCEKKQLPEREELQKKIEHLEKELCYQNASVQELTRKLQLANKVHKQEMLAKVAHFKQSQEQLTQLQVKYEELKLCLKEKELKLERDFIYSNRLLKYPSNNNSRASKNKKDVETINSNSKSRLNESAEKKNHLEMSQEEDVTKENEGEFKTDSYECLSAETSEDRQESLFEFSSEKKSVINNNLDDSDLNLKLTSSRGLNSSMSANDNKKVNHFGPVSNSGPKSKEYEDDKVNSAGSNVSYKLNEKLDDYLTKTSSGKSKGLNEDRINSMSDNTSDHFNEIKPDKDQKDALLTESQTLSKEESNEDENQNFENLLRKRSSSTPRGYLKAYLNDVEKEENEYSFYETSSSKNNKRDVNENQEKSTLIEELFGSRSQQSSSLGAEDNDFLKQLSPIKSSCNEFKSHSFDYQDNFEHLNDLHKNLDEHDSSNHISQLFQQSVNLTETSISKTSSENIFRRNSRHQHSYVDF
ncbi:lebercilin-like [Centruroides sculpturatus]|uniref:lebercilin-like n=1 Tax=Centruroides sculpturatus TaxID=218467 RepID=UPI000C6E1E75|nr:lebercilin-like [Centruroides sculpturatus]XP_023223510.1 lebercilin-like [Centruroides sculpturatus]